jgi:hypothetical protein
MRPDTGTLHRILDRRRHTTTVGAIAAHPNRLPSVHVESASGPPYPTHLCLVARPTLLNCLTAAVSAREQVITCEEVFELLDARPYVTRLPASAT